jgi:hypothetical protein
VKELPTMHDLEIFRTEDRQNWDDETAVLKLVLPVPRVLLWLGAIVTALLLFSILWLSRTGHLS